MFCIVSLCLFCRLCQKCMVLFYRFCWGFCSLLFRCIGVKSSDSKSGGQKCDNLLQEWCENCFLTREINLGEILPFKNWGARKLVCFFFCSVNGILITIYIRQCHVFVNICPERKFWRQWSHFALFHSIVVSRIRWTSVRSVCFGSARNLSAGFWG